MGGESPTPSVVPTGSSGYTGLKSQRMLTHRLGQWFLPYVGQGMPEYEGETVAGMSPEFTSLLNKEREAIGNIDFNKLVQQGTQSASNLLGGGDYSFDEGKLQDMVREQYFDPTMQNLTKDILPAISARRMGRGTTRDIGEDTMLAGAAERAATSIGKGRSELLQWGEGQKLAAAEQQRLSVLSGADLAEHIGKLPMSIVAGQMPLEEYARNFGVGGQAFLSAEQNEWMRTQPEYSPMINQMLQYVGIPQKFSPTVSGGVGTPPQGAAIAGATASGIAAILTAIALMSLACWVAEELYGRYNRKTELARLYSSTVDNWFTRAYRKYGKSWAAWLHTHPHMKAVVRPVWDCMAVHGAQIELNYGQEITLFLNDVWEVKRCL